MMPPELERIVDAITQAAPVKQRHQPSALVVMKNNCRVASA